MTPQLCLERIKLGFHLKFYILENNIKLIKHVDIYIYFWHFQLQLISRHVIDLTYGGWDQNVISPHFRDMAQITDSETIAST